jgi:outer membrane protein OmpA-like peptidoglycan-associated protein
MNRIVLIAPVMAAFAAACASTPPPASPQLRAARVEYSRAAQGPAATDAPHTLRVASDTLDRAQQANDNRDDYATDFAELARSRAELADGQGRTIVAARDVDKARNELVVAQAEQLRAVSRRLGAAEMQSTRGQVAVISTGLLFKTNSAELEPGVKQKLGKVADVLASDPKVNSIVVEGYTDDTGTPQINGPLSDRRADSVATFLESHGIARDRITTHGLSTENPVASNKTAEGRAMNRRVEIEVNPAPTPAAPTMQQPR